MESKVHYLKPPPKRMPDGRDPEEVVEYVCGGCGTVWSMALDPEAVYCPHCGDVGSFYASGNRPSD